MTATKADVPTGNTYDKYGSTNPLVRRMMAGFENSLDQLFTGAAPRSVLDVGCGEGVLTERWAHQLVDARVIGVDLDDPKLQGEWRQRTYPGLEFLTVDVDGGLPFENGEFQLVTAIEVLEHVPSPERLVADMARVANSHLLVSVPREPLWRGLNLARGSYVRDLGNTPGHLNHWSKRAFVEMLSRHGRVSEVRSPFPWTMVLLDVS